MSRLTRLLPLAVAVVLPAMIAPAAVASAAQSYCFSKQATGPGTWAGTYAAAMPGTPCDPTGGLPMTSALTSIYVTGDVAHITITWEFFDGAGGLAFETEQSGVLNLHSGDVVLNGVVTAGHPVGARTHDQGHPTDTNGSYAGVMRVMGHS
jgi:hypothetical protein